MIEFYDVVNQNYIDLCKSQTLNVKVKVELLDHYENALGEITTKVSDTGGSIDIKYNQGMRRTCDITISDINSEMIPNNEHSPFFVNKKFKIYVGLYKHNYRPYQDDVTFWFSQGIFITKDCDYDKKNKVLHLSGVDKFGLFTKDLNQHTLQETYHINADSELGKLISDIVTISMGNGMPTDPKAPIIHTSFVNQVLPYDIEKTANETIGDILVEIATAFNADIYYDTNGHLVFEPNIIDDYNRQAPVFEFNKDDSCLVDISLNFNYGDIVNQITVTGDNSDGAIYSSTAKNENPTSSLRVSNIGIKSADIEETPMGYSDKRCSDYANYLLKKKMRMAIAGTISCTPLPHLDCNRIIKVYQNEDDVNEIDFLIEEIQIPLSPEAYSLSVCNIQDLPLTCYTSMIPQSELSEWVAFKDTDALGKYINRGGETFVVAPAFVNGRSMTAIGGYGYLEDGDTVSSSSSQGSVKGLQGITNLYIEDGITTIESYAFNNASYGKSGYVYNDIETIRFPNTLKQIKNYCFEYAFIDSGDVIIPNGVNISYGFSFSNIKSVVIGDNCEIGRLCFSPCNNLDKAVIGNNCILHGSIFSECCSIEDIDFGLNIDFTDAGGMFSYCYNLTNVNLPIDMKFIPMQMFYECTSLTNIVIPNSVEIIGDHAFEYCYNLTDVNLGNNVEVIGQGAFSNCFNLENITIPNSVENIGSGAFTGTPWLRIKQQENPLVIINQILIDGTTYSGTNIVIPDNVVYIGNGAFYECSNIISVTIPDSVTKIGNDAFRQCTSLASITIPNGVTSINDYVFYGCTSLTGITIPNGVTSIGYCAFEDCKSLANIVIPDNVVDIGARAFAYCTKLSNVIIGRGIIKIRAAAFKNCTNLASITIPESVTDIENGVFENCSSLTSVYISDIESWCNINFYDEFSNPLYRIQNLYLNNELISDVVVPDSITSIKNYAFIGCKNLQNIILPESVASIGYYSFLNCKSLESIIIKNSNCEIYDSKYTISSTATIYGYTNSTAQAYAKKYNRTFVEITE